jgi:hypothetical protein
LSSKHISPGQLYILGNMDPGDILNRGRDRMVVGFTDTYAISVYHHYACEFEPRSWRGIIDTTLCDKVYNLFFVSFNSNTTWQASLVEQKLLSIPE